MLSHYFTYFAAIILCLLYLVYKWITTLTLLDKQIPELFFAPYRHCCLLVTCKSRKTNSDIPVLEIQRDVVPLRLYDLSSTNDPILSIVTTCEER